MEVESEEGKGSTFCFTNQRVATQMLEKQRHTVTVASDGREALAYLREPRFFNGQPFDVVLMDIQTLRMDGFEATATICTEESIMGGHIPIIAMTAHAMKGDRERCLEAGMDDYLSKPIQAKTLFALIESVISKLLVAEAAVSLERLADEAAAPIAVPCDLGNDPEWLRGIANLFVEMCPQDLAEIRAALVQGDGQALERAAHKLKGAIAHFDAPAALEAAAKLERLGKAGDLSQAAEVMRLEEGLERFVATLAALKNKDECGVS
jgi:two-component system sensor histidine kinase/response regulator